MGGEIRLYALLQLDPLAIACWENTGQTCHPHISAGNVGLFVAETRREFAVRLTHVAALTATTA